ncbi:MAG: asparagine synthase (glutamine-hydrolyzing) [Crocinitomicaceae bacterium]
MCGLNGIYEFSGYKKGEDVINRMNEALAHRGPDAEGFYRDEFIHLGHRRLSILDTGERSNQPFTSEDGRFVLVFNGEIYNYREIRNQLDHFDFKTDSDTEVVLAAYMQWGANCLRSFNGMFAFAVWDNVKQELFLARDRLGIKPLYYVLTDHEIIFSSSLSAVLSTNLIPRKINSNSLVDYLRFQTVHAPYTIIEGVFCLMPGQQLLISEEKGIEFKYYWTLTDNYQPSKDDLPQTQQKIRNLLSESVEKRLVADVPFGAFLSGGIDSSIIVGLMAETHDQKIDTFSVVFKENEFSEREFAKIIADKFKTRHHEIELSVNEFKELIPDALSFMDHPSGDGPNTFVVSKKTREAGVKMALSGLGGDELFGGYSVFNQIPELQQKKWLNSFPAYARKPLANLYHQTKRTVASSKIREILKQEYFDMEFIYQFYRQVFMDDQVKKLLKIKALPTNQSFKIVHDQVGYTTKGWKLPPLSRISVAEISTYMQNVLLRDADQMSMAHGLELRVPFLDHQLVEYILGVPDSLKRPVTPKKLLVDSFSGMLPDEIYNRPKMGFVLPYEIWMRGELKSFCQERLDALKTINLIKEDELDRLWLRFLKNDRQISWSRVWPLVVLGDWIKRNKIEG